MLDNIAAVVVAYRNRDDLAACYRSLRSSSGIRDIFIVDNSYGDVGSCLEYAGMRDIDDRTFHIIAPRNLGYAGGNNLGVLAAKLNGADCILICNPDVIVSSGVAEALLCELRERNVDLISPQLLEDDARGAKRILSAPGWDCLLGRGVVEIPSSASTTRYVPTFYGACFLVTTRVVDAIGGLSEDFFLYGEEIDYTFRIEKAGFAWAISQRVIVPHARGSSISPESTVKSLVAFFHSARSAVLVGRKYAPVRLIVWVLARLGLAAWLQLRGNHHEARAIVGGLADGLRAPLRVTQ